MPIHPEDIVQEHYRTVGYFTLLMPITFPRESQGHRLGFFPIRERPVKQPFTAASINEIDRDKLPALNPLRALTDTV